MFRGTLCAKLETFRISGEEDPHKVNISFATRSLFTLLLVAVGVISLLQWELADTGRVRWAGYSVLPPLVAAALLSLRQTAVVGAAAIASALVTYGMVIGSISTGGRIVVITAVILASALALFTCVLRLRREHRLQTVMVARDRLTLLGEASRQIGSTLDVARTARELADVSVPRFADFVTVDLFDAVLRGEEPPAGPFEGPVALRRVAQRSVLRGTPEALLDPGEMRHYPEISMPARSLASGEPVAASAPADEDVERWLALEPDRAASIREHGFHSAITVPLSARGTTLGVAVFARHRRPEPFDAEDVILGEEVATRAAVCLDNARRYTHEHSTSVALQRSLLPKRLPAQAAVEAAGRYLPAGAYGGVGGDWFDVIPLSSARVALVVGDVVGHGLLASAAMGRLRTAVRTLADIDLPPDELLTHLDDVVIRLGSETDSEDSPGYGDILRDVGATCLYGIYDPVTRRCVLARAGHPGPMLVRPDGTVEPVDLPAGPPLGLGGMAFESAEIQLPEDSVLALFTDGLVTSHRRDFDDGLLALRKALTRGGPTLDSMCDTIIETMLSDGHPSDDAALLLARTRTLDAAHVAGWEVPVTPDAVATARAAATRQVIAWGLEDRAFTVELVVSELVTNAIRHASGPIQLRIIREKALICEVSDSLATAPHLRRARIFDEGGRGLFIVASLTARWGTRQNPDGKTIWAEVPLPP